MKPKISAKIGGEMTTSIKVESPTLQKFNQVVKENDLQGHNQNQTVKRLLEDYERMKKELQGVGK